jgi:hypothetical protein
MIRYRLNEGTDPSIVAKATKHRDPRMISRYIREGEGVNIAPAMSFGRSFSSCVNSGKYFVDVTVIASSSSEVCQDLSSSSSGTSVVC